MQSCARASVLGDLGGALTRLTAPVASDTFILTPMVVPAIASQNIASFSEPLENPWRALMEFTNGKFVYKGEDNEQLHPDVQPVFFLGDAMYVPHYVTPHIWVSFGNAKLTTKNLIERNAKLGTSYLWVRPWIEKILGTHDIFTMKESQLKEALIA
jgi:hypothetical protein